MPLTGERGRPVRILRLSPLISLTAERVAAESMSRRMPLSPGCSAASPAAALGGCAEKLPRAGALQPGFRLMRRWHGPAPLIRSKHDRRTGPAMKILIVGGAGIGFLQR